MEDASLGISKESFVKNEKALRKRVRYINHTYNQPALVEQYVYGRELNVAILGYKSPQVLPISEIMFGFNKEPKIVDYPAKWFTESDEYKMTKPMCPAIVEPSIKNKIEKVALKSFEALHCRDYARVDVRLDDETPYVIEVNPNPDISPDAGFSRSLKAAGISYEEFIELLIEFSKERRDSIKFNKRSIFKQMV
jgi:D-alanine-D-alanine ligase